MSYSVNQKVADATTSEIQSRWTRETRRPSWDAVEEEAVQAGRPPASVLDVATVLRTSPQTHPEGGNATPLGGGRSRYEESK